MHLSAILGSEPLTDPDQGAYCTLAQPCNPCTSTTRSPSRADAFAVFSQDIPSSSLGFIDAHAAALELTVAGADLVIHQSRGLLTSQRKAGTTGAGT